VLDRLQEQLYPGVVEQPPEKKMKKQTAALQNLLTQSKDETKIRWRHIRSINQPKKHWFYTLFPLQETCRGADFST